MALKESLSPGEKMSGVEAIALKAGDQSAESGAPAQLNSDASNLLGQLSNSVRQLSKTNELQERANILARMQSESKALQALLAAGSPELLTTYTAALTKLFNPLSADLEHINASVLRTTSHAIDFLSQFLPRLCPSELSGKLPLRVLIVDDDAICRATLQLALQNPHLSVTACDTPEKALSWMRHENCDLIFSDIMMPHMDGLALAAEIRKLANHNITPIIFITVLSDFATRSKSVMSGGCELIAKPFINSEVLVKAFTIGLKHRLSRSEPSKAAPNSKAASVPGQKEELAADPMTTATFEKKPQTETASTRTTQPADPTGFICLDGEGRIKSINKICGEILSYQLNEVVGWHITKLVPDDLQPKNAAGTVVQMLSADGSSWQELEVVAQCGNGSTLKAKLTLMGAHSQGKRQFIGLIRPAVKSSEPSLETTPSAPAVAAEPPPAPELQSPIAPPAPAPIAETEKEPSSPPAPAPTVIRLAGNGSALPKPPLRNVSLLGPSVKEPKLAMSASAPEIAPSNPEDVQSSNELANHGANGKNGTNGHAAVPQEPLSTPSIPLSTTPAAEEASLEDDAELQQLLEEAEELREKMAEEAAIEVTRQQMAIASPVEDKEEECAAPTPAKAALEEEASQPAQELVLPAPPQKKSEVQTAEPTLAIPPVVQLKVTKAEPAPVPICAEIEPIEPVKEPQAAEVTSMPTPTATKAVDGRETSDKAAAFASTPIEASERPRNLELETRIQKLEHEKAELSKHSEAASQRNRLWQQSVQSLQTELDQARSLRERELQEQAEREGKLKEDCASLELQTQALEDSLARIRTQLKEETARKTALEKKAQDLFSAQKSLSRELAERKRSEEQWQREANERQEKLKLQTESLAAEQRNLSLKSQELQAAQSALAELSESNSSLQRELTVSNESAQTLRRSIEELEANQQSALEKLATLRNQLKAEVSQKQRLEAAVSRLEQSKAELTRQLEAASERYKLWQDTIQSLQSELEQARSTYEQSIAQHVKLEGELKEELSELEKQARTLESSLQQAQSEVKTEMSRRTSAEKKADELNGIRTSLERELTTHKRTFEQQQREAKELEEQLRSQANQLSAEQKKLESKITQLQVRDVKRSRENAMKLAGLRYAILDGARLNSQVGEQDNEGQLHAVSRLMQLTSSLLNTPLSKAQRHLANALRTSLETWSSDSLDATRTDRLRFEAFASANDEFVAEELIGNAIRVLRMNASEIGAEVHLSTSGEMNQTYQGDSAHIYQLITLLGSSLTKFAKAKRLDLRIAMGARSGSPEATFQFAVTAAADASSLRQRCLEVTSASSQLQVDGFSEAESELATAWQLAAALGGVCHIETAAEKQLQIRIVLPFLGETSELAGSRDSDPALSAA